MREVTLQDERLQVRVLPDHGCDIASVIDRASGTELLFQTPWGRRDRRHLPQRADSRTAWHDAYGGGWQVLCPNAGPERDGDGVRWGFHGEANLLAWDVLDAGPAHAELEVGLLTAPLTLHRRVTLAGGVLRVDERLSNDSAADVEVAWQQHPAFGPPLVAGGARIEAGAARMRADADVPGDLLPPGGEWDWPHAHAIDLRTLPEPDEPRALLAYLMDFTRHEAAIVNERLGLAARLRWDGDAWPHAWLWQEVHATAGYPWFRRAHAIAIEPASTVPGGPLARVPAGGARAAWIELEVR